LLTTYTLALFVHVIAAMSVFSALGVEGVALVQARRASKEAEVQLALAALRSVRWFASLSLLLALASGIYLGVTLGSAQGAWLGVSLFSVVLVAVIGGRMTLRRITQLHDARGARPPQVPLRDPVLWRSFTLRTALLVSIVFQMAVKPTAVASVVVMGVSVGLAWLLGHRRLPS
jgi:hypothetical protein